MPTSAVMWFRRDLRLADNPALLDACGSRRRDCSRCSCSTPRCGGRPEPVPPAPTWWSSLRSARGSRSRDGGRTGLSVVRGDPVRQVVLAARGGRRRPACTSPPTTAPTATGATSTSRPPSPSDDIELVRTGSPYAVAPGPGEERLRLAVQGLHALLPRAWLEHGWREPVNSPHLGPRWLALDRHRRPARRSPCPPGSTSPRPGGGGARHWRAFLRSASPTTTRAGPARPDATSRMSHPPAVGEIHPRTARRPGKVGRRRGDLPPRARLAGVLRTCCSTAATHGSTFAPSSAGVRRARRRGSPPGTTVRTGFPIVDAGMRQLRATGWMHNRVRMIVARSWSRTCTGLAARRAALHALAG